jgi:hypothetical protein
LPAQCVDTIDHKTLVIEFDAAVLDAAVMRQHVENRIAAGKIGMSAVGAPDRPGTLGFPQHVQARRVIDLPVDEDDSGKRRVAKSSTGLQYRVGA